MDHVFLSPNRQWLIASVLFLAFLLVGCNLMSSPNYQAPNSGAINTAIAQTVAAQVTNASGEVSAQQTLAVGQTAVALLTAISTGQPTSAQATPTAGVVTPLPPASPTPTQAQPSPTLPVPTATNRPTATATPIPCNLAQYVRDVTIPDGTIVSPGENFTKIWRLRNVGSCNWDANYSVIFVSGTAMTNRTVQGIAAVVRPGEAIDIAVDFTAPTAQGEFVGNWMLRSPSGAVFGVGASGETAFFVDIRVVARANPNYEYDLAANFCSAEWRTAEGIIPCGGSTNDSRGSVAYITDPALETRQENEPALWVRPSRGRDGYITGTYPSYTIHENDHLVTEISCLSGDKACKVVFQLDYMRSNGAVKNLGIWEEVHDGNTRIVDIDLTQLAGEKVRFILSVRNDSKNADSSALWFVPSIRRVVTTSSQVMEWRQQGGSSNVCSVLKLYLYGTSGGEAAAYDCHSGKMELIGSEPLDLSSYNQLTQWVSTLAAFDSKVIPSSSPDRPTTWISLSGKGNNIVSASELQAMDNYAQYLFNTNLSKIQQ